MEKNILTWTNLCNMAARCAKTRPDDFRELVQTGTDRFLPGYWTTVVHDREFRIHRSGGNSSPQMMSIYGFFSDEGYFTKFLHKLTPTSYRKRFWDRHMPVSFPTGLPLRGTSAPCTYHNPSGDTQSGKVSFSKWRNEVAAFSVACENRGRMIFNDTTGKLVNIHDSRLIAPDAGPVIEVYPYTQGDPESVRNFPWYRQATLSDTLRGVQHGAVTSRDEWLKSIWRACEAGLMDKYKCLPLAARMWNAAYRLCHANSSKHARMIAYPIEALPTGKNSTYGIRSVLEWQNPRLVELDGQQEGIPMNASNAVHYRLPQLEIHWEGERDYDTARNNPAIIMSTRMDPRYVSMTLPPHGNGLLYDKPHYGSPHCRTAPSQSRMNGEQVVRNNDAVSVLSDDRLIVQFLERAYHSLPIFDPAKLNEVEGIHVRSRMYNTNHSWAEVEAGGTPYAKWRDYQDCVYVKSNFDESHSGKDGVWSEYTQGSAGMPATPESAVSMVEEAALIDSLPLS